MYVSVTALYVVLWFYRFMSSGTQFFKTQQINKTMVCVACFVHTPNNPAY